MKLRNFNRVLVLSITLMAGFFGSFAFDKNVTTVKADTSSDVNDLDVFIKQQTNYTCTLASATMMIRRTAILRGDAQWSTITEPVMRGCGWIEGSGLMWSFSYANSENGISKITVGHATLPGTEGGNISALIDILANHPEGVALYNADKPHAILLTDYTDGVFYCADPAPNSPHGRIPISEAYAVSIANADRYWYIESYCGESDSNNTDDTYDEGDSESESNEKEVVGNVEEVTQGSNIETNTEDNETLDKAIDNNDKDSKVLSNSDNDTSSNKEMTDENEAQLSGNSEEDLAHNSKSSTVVKQTSNILSLNGTSSCRLLTTSKSMYLAFSKGKGIIIIKDINNTDVSNEVYTKNKVNQRVTITYSGYTLREGTDFDVTYLKDDVLGVETLVISGLNSYMDEISNTDGFVIKKYYNKNYQENTTAQNITSDVYGYTICPYILMGNECYYGESTYIGVKTYAVIEKGVVVKNEPICGVKEDEIYELAANNNREYIDCNSNGHSIYDDYVKNENIKESLTLLYIDKLGGLYAVG